MFALKLELTVVYDEDEFDGTQYAAKRLAASYLRGVADTALNRGYVTGDSALTVDSYTVGVLEVL